MNILSKIMPAVLVSVFVLSACAPPHRRLHVQPPTPPPEVTTKVYFYPNQGQSLQRQDRDRFDCHLWAKQQTGFDPSRPNLAPHQRMYIVPQPATGQDTVAGAFTGAILGAIIGSPHNSGEGALIGALAGAVLGATSDAARQEQAYHEQAYCDQLSANDYARLDRQARQYRRAMGACLEGRAYTVR